MISYKDELYHHGIKGQKWGVRRFQNEDGSLTAAGKSRYSEDSFTGRKANKFQAKADKHIAKIASSKTRLGKNFHNLMAYGREIRANTYGNYANDKGKGFKKLVSNYTGSGRLSAMYKAEGDYYSRKAEYSKTKLGKSINESKGFNRNSSAAALAKTHEAIGGQGYLKSVADGIFSRPIKTWSGRQTTTGARFVEKNFTLDAGLVKDIKAYKNKP